MRQSLEELLCDVGHGRVEHLESCIEADVKGVESGSFLCRGVRFHHGFYCLKVDVRKIFLPEVIQVVDHGTEAVLLKVLVRALDEQAQPRQNPAIGQ